MESRRHRAAYLTALLTIALNGFLDRSRGAEGITSPARSRAAALVDSAEPISVPDPAAAGASAVIAAVQGALASLDAAKLTAPFGGHPPAWAREWVRRRGRKDLFDRQWYGTVAHLPSPYHGCEWLAVFSMYHPVEADADHFHRLEQRDGVWSIGPEVDERAPGTEFQITHHDLRISLIPGEHRLAAEDAMSVHRSAAAGDMLLARMSEDLQVQAASAAGRPAPFARAGGLLAIRLPTGSPTDLRIEIKYGGVVHHPGVDDVDPEGSFLFSYWYPNVARLPASADLTVTAPASWTVIAEGEPLSREALGDQARTFWRQSHPVCWLEMAAGPYQRTSQSVSGKKLNVYLLKPDAGKAREVIDTVARALPYYSRTFFPFPWTHYDVVEYPMTLGALEGYTMTTMRPELMPRAVPHELSHSWWGGLVPNTYTVDMWNEAFATYSERLVKEATNPGTALGGEAGGPRPRRRARPTTVPIIGASDALDPLQSVVGYSKGAAVLHMFRHTVGDPLFFRTLTRFARERQGQATTWRDFQRVAEVVSGQELGWFFDPWLTRTDLPRLRWGMTQLEGDRLTASIESLNLAYRLRLPVEIETSDGRRRTETVTVSGPHTQVRTRPGEHVKQMVLDPAGDFLLEPAADGPHPWTLDLAGGSAAAGPTVRRPTLSEAQPFPVRAPGRHRR